MPHSPRGDDACALTTEGHDNTLDLGEGLQAGPHCCLGVPGALQERGRWAYCTAQGEASPGQQHGAH